MTQIAHCWHWWRTLRADGHFAMRDATLQLHRVILPARFAYNAAGRALKANTRISQIEPETHRIELVHHDLVFYWRGRLDNNLHFLIEQEFNPGNPHCYTTDPIQLKSESVVIDVGACEGLFAYRLLKTNQCQRVICFEPLPAMASLIEKGAAENGIADRLKVEALAVSDLSGPVRLVATDNPDACRIEPCNTEPEKADSSAIRLDDYLAQRDVSLRSIDLIKIDAEGTDLSVIHGAAETIARYRPQIAVTTYHLDEHVTAIKSTLEGLCPDYRFRLKGFSHWTAKPEAGSPPSIHDLGFHVAP